MDDDNKTTIADMLRLKREAAERVAEALNKFTETTGLVVGSVGLRCIDTTTYADSRRQCTYRVQLDVELP